MSYEAKIKPLDDLFTLFYIFSPVASAMLVSFGVDSRLLHFPLIMFLLWTIYVYFYRAKYQLHDQQELGLIERARGLTYFFGLVASLVGVSFAFYLPGFVNNLVIIVLTVAFLFLIEQTVPRTFFKKQTATFTKDQKKKFTEVLFFADNVSYYFSVIIVVINSTLFNLISLATFFLFVPGCIVLSFLFYRQERKSRKLARNLAISLRGTKWVRKYTGKKTRSARS